MFHKKRNLSYTGTDSDFIYSTEAKLHLPLGKQPAIFHIERRVLDVFPRPDKITTVVVKRFFNIFAGI